jgi:hypothetical protein
MVSLVKGHRGCGKARGCGCGIDRTLDALARAERELFDLEIAVSSEMALSIPTATPEPAP